MKRIAAAGLLFFGAAFAGAPTAMPLASTDKTVTGQQIVSPEHPTVISSVATFLPGDKTVVHKHPYPHYGYMLEGTLTIVNT
jgi:quercetin dioxygenase-like cupin family protein